MDIDKLKNLRARVDQATSQRLEDLLDLLIAEAEKPRERWRAEKGERYWSLDGEVEVYSPMDLRDSMDEKKFNLGNYFETKELAQAAALKLGEFWKSL